MLDLFMARLLAGLVHCVPIWGILNVTQVLGLRYGSTSLYAWDPWRLFEGSERRELFLLDVSMHLGAWMLAAALHVLLQALAPGAPHPRGNVSGGNAHDFSVLHVFTVTPTPC